jgi:hypothetical protein
MLLIYPLFVWFDRVFAENYMRARRREWKIFAIQLSIVEGQMLTSINAMRKAMGEDPIESHILMDQFNTSEWRILSIESKKLAARAIEEIEGRHRVISS